MPRFLLHAIAGIIGTGIFYSALPMLMAMGINALWPFGFDSLTATNAIKIFGVSCVAVLLPISAVSVLRSSRRMFFASTDGRPALFGSAGSGLRAERNYRARALLAAAVALLSAISAMLLGFALYRQATTGSALAVPYLCLVAVAAGLAAVESNDLRRTVRLTLYASDA